MSSGWWNYWFMQKYIKKYLNRGVPSTFFYFPSWYICLYNPQHLQRLFERTAMQTQYTVLFFMISPFQPQSYGRLRAFISLWTVSDTLAIFPLPHLQFLNTLQFLQNEWFFICQFLPTSVSYFFHITPKQLQCRLFSQFYNFFCQLIFVSSFLKPSNKKWWSALSAGHFALRYAVPYQNWTLGGFGAALYILRKDTTLANAGIQTPTVNPLVHSIHPLRHDGSIQHCLQACWTAKLIIQQEIQRTVASTCWHLELCKLEISCHAACVWTPTIRDW